MGSIFSGPKMPEPQPVPPAPDPADTSIAQAADQQASLERKRRGRSASILTGLSPDAAAAVTTRTPGLVGGSKTILGG